MADLAVVEGDYEQVAESLGKAVESLGKMKAGGLAGRVVGALPSSVGGGAFAGAEGKLTRERDGLAETCGQTRSGVQDTIVSFTQTEEELEQLAQSGVDALAKVGAGVA